MNIKKVLIIRINNFIIPLTSLSTSYHPKFKVIKKVLGMIQIRLDSGNDIVIREELFGDIDYD